MKNFEKEGYRFADTCYNCSKSVIRWNGPFPSITCLEHKFFNGSSSATCKEHEIEEREKNVLPKPPIFDHEDLKALTRKGV